MATEKRPAHEDDDQTRRFLEECERRIRAAFCREFPGLCSSDVDNVLQEVALALCEKSKKTGIWLMHDSDLRLAVSIARNKARDIFRHHSREEKKRLGRHQRMCQSPSLWGQLNDLEREEIATIVARTADELTPFQLWLWEQYVEHFPDSQKSRYLAKVTGIWCSSAKLKCLIDEIRSCFLRDLGEGGYDLDQFK